MTLASNHIREVFKGHRKRKTVPFFITTKQWNLIEHKRKTDPCMIRQFVVNTKNRSSQKAIDARVYRGGSPKLLTWIEKVVSLLNVKYISLCCCCIFNLFQVLFILKLFALRYNISVYLFRIRWTVSLKIA